MSLLLLENIPDISVFKSFKDTSAVPVQTVLVQNVPFAWPLVLLLADFSRTAHPN